MKNLISLALALLLAGCSIFPAQHAETMHIYLLDAKPAAIADKPRGQRMIAVGMPTSQPGFDTPKMAYQRKPYELEYFATHRWADTPARMLRPLIVAALEPAAIAQGSAALRLDTELVRLQQDFTSQPSRIRITLRAQLIDVKMSRVIATRVFDETENAASDDPYGGVIAANLALARLLDDLGKFCGQ